jgi:hypothetical protein
MGFLDTNFFRKEKMTISSTKLIFGDMYFNLLPIQGKPGQDLGCGNFAYSGITPG